jgi:glucose-1-phosphate thymidylyltransferase
MSFKNQKQTIPYDLVGVIPAAGTASRLGRLPCSKELLPIRFRNDVEKTQAQIKPISQYLLEKMQLAGVSKVYIILRKGKWDIPKYFGDGTILNMNIAYLLMGLPFGVPFTVDQAYPFVKDAMVVFGFADIIYEPEDAFQQLLAKQQKTKADIVLGLFEASQAHQEDMVDFKSDGRIKAIDVKPSGTKLNHTWMIAVWTPGFTNFMHHYLGNLKRSIEHGKMPKTGNEKPELFLGHIIQAAIDENMAVNSVCFTNGCYLDIGTPESLAKNFKKLL